MRVLAIGVQGIPNSIQSDLLQANVFEDYDAVIVSPHSFRALYGDEARFTGDRTRRYLDRDLITLLENTNEGRREQVRGLTKKGGLVICFLQPHLAWNDINGREAITSYDWLFDSDEILAHFDEIRCGSGTTVDYIDKGHPFGEYLLTRPAWEAYIGQNSCNPDDWRTLASAFGTHLVSIARTPETGHIIFLPSEYDAKKGDLLEQCVRRLLGNGDITPVPEWAQSISVPGQDKIAEELNVIETEIRALTEKQNSLVLRNAELERWKWLLYETGKHRLEPAVHNALSLLGCKVEPQPDSASDGKVESEFGIALLEIEGAEGAVKIGKISQLLRNIADFLAQESSPAKGILVGNPFRCNELANRPPKGSQKKLFSDPVIETAERHEISVLLSTDLYDVVCLILDNKLSDTQIENLRKLIFEGKGLVRLSVP